MRKQVSVFYSGDFDLKAIVYENADNYEVDFGKNGLLIKTESYEGKSLIYHEDAAENYVNGIKKI
jgi:hypothetical protein